MATEVTSMENERLSRAGEVPPPPPPLRPSQRQPAMAGGARAARPLQHMLSSFSSSSSSSSSPSRESSFAGLPSPARSSGASGALTARSGGSGISGVWASIMSLGAAALPTSFAPLSAAATATSTAAAAAAAATGSSPATPHRARRHGAVVPSRSRGMINGASLSLTSSSLSSLSSSSSSPSSLVTAEALPAGVDHSAMVQEIGGGERARDVGPAVAAGGEVAMSSGVPASAPGNAFSVMEVSEEVGGAATASGSGGAAGAAHKIYLEGGRSVYTCSMCRAHLATRDHVVSECFHGHGGRAFLFERCVNVTAGRPEDRLLMTGMHVVADISCTACGAELGWKYEEAAEKSQKYKEGKFILERCAVTLEDCAGEGRHGSNRFGSNRCGSDRFGSDRFGSSDIIGWGADNAPFADSARW